MNIVANAARLLCTAARIVRSPHRCYYLLAWTTRSHAGKRGISPGGFLVRNSYAASRGVASFHTSHASKRVGYWMASNFKWFWNERLGLVVRPQAASSYCQRVLLVQDAKPENIPQWADRNEALRNVREEKPERPAEGPPEEKDVPEPQSSPQSKPLPGQVPDITCESISRVALVNTFLSI